jgi:hypothetical protein
VPFFAAPGTRPDCRHQQAVPLLSAVTSLKHLTADKAYDADRLRNWLKTRRQPFGLESSLFCQAIQMD